ncbi:MAG: FtsX-like permease family protein, partial [Bacteroidota bacterium]|nr:FtsX-like permease family protein [Bacteroidota bacterium]MDX5469551.1 FtsX-like permease family protein [Bacteroidota bacterium]
PNFYASTMGDYFRMMAFHYLKLAEGVSPGILESKFTQFYRSKIDPWIKQNDVNGSMSYGLQALEEIHLSNEWNFDYPGNSNRSYLYIFGAVGLFLLIIAAINYVNLSTARAGTRAKEVGIRMVSGATRKELIFQFLTEALLHMVVALVLALSLVELLLPLFNHLSDKNFDHQTLFSPQSLLMLGVLCGGMTIVSGFYPAFYLSSIEPGEVVRLKAQSKAGIQGWKRFFGPVYMRRYLVVLQFTLSIGLIIGTLTVSNQFGYMRSKNLGFDKENVFILPVPNDSAVNNHLPRIKSELLKLPAVDAVASCSEVPGGHFGKLYFVVDHEVKRVNKILGFSFVDESFIPMMKLQLEGRNFDPANVNDPQASFIINRTCAEFLGWENPIGKMMENGLGMKGTVIGVVDDFHYTSLHTPIEPMVMMFRPEGGRNILVKMKAGNEEAAYEEVLTKWKTFAPNHPLEAYFMDEFMNRNYI